MKKVSFKGASWDSIFLAVTKIVTTLASIIEAKILSVGFNLTDYGTYSEIHVVISICTALLLLGLGDALNYFYNNQSTGYDKEKRIRFVNTIFALELIAGIILALGLFFGRGLISGYYSNPDISPLIIFIAFRPMIANMISLYQILFVSVGRAKIIATKNLILSLINVGVLIVSVYIFHNIRAVFICTLTVSVFQLLFFALYFGKKEFLLSPRKVDFSLVKKIIPYALPMGVYALTSTLTRDTDRLVIGFLSNTETVAIYTNCSKILPFDIIAASFATVLIPYIMRYITGGDGRSISLFKNYLKIGYYSVFIFGFGTILVTHQIIPFLYDSKYLTQTSIFVFILYVLDSMLKFASVHLILVAAGKTKTIMGYSLAVLGANVILNVALFYLFGLIDPAFAMVGPAVSTLIVTASYTLAILNQTRKMLKTTWNELFDFRDLFLFIGCIFAVGGVTYLLKYLLLKTPLHEYIVMFISLAFFAGLILLLFCKRIFAAVKTINSLKLSDSSKKESVE